MNRTRRFKARVDVSCELLVWVFEDEDGEQEIEDVLELINFSNDFDILREE